MVTPKNQFLIETCSVKRIVGYCRLGWYELRPSNQPKSELKSETSAKWQVNDPQPV